MSSTYSEDIEARFLSSLIQDPSLHGVIEDLVTPEALYWPPFRMVFEEMGALIKQDIPPTYSGVVAQLDKVGRLNAISVMSNGKKGKDALTWLQTLEENPLRVEAYALQLQGFKASRDLAELGNRVLESVKDGIDPSEILANLDISSGKISLNLGTSSKNIRELGDAAHKAFETLKDVAKGKLKFIKSGLEAWDGFVKGFFPGRLYLVAAFQNDGKSAFATNLAYRIGLSKNIAERKKVFFLTMEMSAEEIANRLVQMITGVSVLKIESGELSKDEAIKVKEAYEFLESAKDWIIIDDSPEITIPVLKYKIRRAKQLGAELVIIDQLDQIIINAFEAGTKEYTKVNWATYRIKAAAREFNIPIVLVHQLNRGNDGQESKKQARPVYEIDATALSQAGERAPDVVVIIRHQRDMQKIIKSYFVFVKHRQGVRGVSRVDFDGEHISFNDSISQAYDEDDDDLPQWARQDLEDYDNGEYNV